jgi:predicted dehydrogenase
MMTDALPIRTAVVGFGTAGRFFHAPFLAADAAFRIDAIVTNEEHRAGHARDEHPGARVLSRTDDLWAAKGDLDLVVIASPGDTHVELARAALLAGYHVVVDKPFVPQADEGEALIALAKERGCMLTVFHNRRWDGDFLTVAELVRSGRLGEVRRFESRFEWWQPIPDAGWKSTTSVAHAGGILFDLGPHLIDQATQLFGPVRQVHAEIATRREQVAADDDVFLALQHENGVISHLWMSAVAPAQGPRFRVLGSDAGYTSWGLDGQETALRDGAEPGGDGFGETPAYRWGELTVGEKREPVPSMRGDYGRFYAGVAAAILYDAPAPVDPADAVEAVRLIARSRDASERAVPAA